MASELMSAPLMKTEPFALLMLSTNSACVTADRSLFGLLADGAQAIKLTAHPTSTAIRAICVIISPRFPPPKRVVLHLEHEQITL